MTNIPIRVRFAPAPTGTMHLGNIRTALMNFLFAKKMNGTFVLRIEDTDAQRNYDPQAHKIIEHLLWLGLNYDEGPFKGGKYAPYFQSERLQTYQKVAQTLISAGQIYRCFCTEQELEKKRERHISLKLAPRYDRTCMSLKKDSIEKLLGTNSPYIWRMKLDHEQKVIINDLARGKIAFELKNFSDFPITRANGSFTFIFANFVDDLLMDITHVFRGEDHLSNTASQAALYHALNKELPVYYHLPILCNISGQKLSKRDFGFSIIDLQTGGFLPEAICNYLLTLGASFKEEIMPFDELPLHAQFQNIHSTGQIKYDEHKLRWFNHRFIQLYDPAQLTRRCLPFIRSKFTQIDTYTETQVTQLIQVIKPEMHTLCDAADLLSFIFSRPILSIIDLQACIHEEKIALIPRIIKDALPLLENSKEFVSHLKKQVKLEHIELRDLFTFIRLALSGSAKGLGISELIDLVGKEETEGRLLSAIAICADHVK